MEQLIDENRRLMGEGRQISPLSYITRFNLSGGSSDAYLDFSAKLRDEINGRAQIISFDSFYLLEQENYTFFGGFLFLGIFFGVIFLAAAALIIYYKQVSEGYQDHERFEILQKVGMSLREVKKTIDKQILMVFFLPLMTAILHLVFATRVIGRLLILFGLMDFTFIVACSVGTVLVFIGLYAIIYKLTARSYAKLVS